MRTRTNKWLVGGGAALAAGLALWALRPPARPHPTATPHPARRTQSPSPSTRSHSSQQGQKGKGKPPVPALPQVGRAAGTATASFAVVAHAPPAVPIQRGTAFTGAGTWAVAPMGTTTTGTPGHPTLWAGVRTAAGWRWIPTTLPGAIPAALPTPFRDALQWAYDLHAGQAGPQLVGPIPWSAVAGQVGEPVGWTLTPETENTSILGQPGFLLTVWLPSEQYPHVYDGLETVWDAQNARDGAAALWQIVPASGSLTTILHP